MTTSGLEVEVGDGRITVLGEGKLAKFVETVDEVSFSGTVANRRGQKVRYITERAVFELGDGHITLIEIAPGLDPASDVIAHMGFVPEISDDLTEMDPRVFAEATMGLATEFGVAR
jgi:acyl CoA:acetate/3-ketoacid CoA transferase